MVVTVTISTAIVAKLYLVRKSFTASILVPNSGRVDTGSTNGAWTAATGERRRSRVGDRLMMSHRVFRIRDEQIQRTTRPRFQSRLTKLFVSGFWTRSPPGHQFPFAQCLLVGLHPLLQLSHRVYSWIIL